MTGIELETRAGREVTQPSFAVGQVVICLLSDIQPQYVKITEREWVGYGSSTGWCYSHHCMQEGDNTLDQGWFLALPDYVKPRL